MQTTQQRIADLEAILDSGVTAWAVDGVTQTIDPDAIRARIEELKAQDAVRPPMVTLDLSKAW